MKFGPPAKILDQLYTFYEGFCRPSDGVRKKMENYAEIFSNIMRKKVMIILKLIKLFPWLFQRYKIHANVFPIILTPSWRVWPFAAIYGQVFLRSTQFLHSFFPPKLSNQALKLEPRPITKRCMECLEKPGGLKLLTNKKAYVFLVTLLGE